MRSLAEADHDWGQKVLEAACAMGNIELAEALVESGIDISTGNSMGWSPVYIACRNGHVDILKLLVEAGGDVTLSGDGRQTPLSIAAFEGCVEAAKLLLKFGANASNANDHGKTPLEIASDRGHCELVKLFLDNGAFIANGDAGNSPALCSASAKGYFDIIKLLVNSGADISVSDEAGWTPLHAASQNGHIDVVKLLIHHGAKTAAKEEGGWTPLCVASGRGHIEVVRELLAKGASTSIATDDGGTPLFAACYNGHLEVVRLLLEHDADVMIVHQSGLTPLVAAARHGHLGVVKLLCKHGADLAVTIYDQHRLLGLASEAGDIELVMVLIRIGASIDSKLNDNWTPLHIASNSGHVEMVSLLLANGADHSIPNDIGRIPLHTAIVKEHIDIARLLLDHGSCINIVAIDGSTPLTLASWRGNAAIVAQLLENGANSSLADNNGWNPLHYASDRGHGEVVEVLLEKGAAIDLATHTLSTPLHLSSVNGCANVVDILLEQGANTTPVDSHGRSPLYYAAAGGHVDVLNLLLNQQADVTVSDNLGVLVNAACVNGHIEIVEAILRRGASVLLTDDDGLTPVIAASYSGNIELLRFLLSKGFGVLEANRGGLTALQVASREGHVDVVTLLLDSGAVMSPDRRLFTPLHIASSHGNTLVVKTLIEKGADVSATQDTGLTALHLASAGGHIEVASLLLRHGANIAALTFVGASPLHCASFEGHSEVTQLLLENGADAGLLNDTGMTPIFAASIKGHHGVIKTLLKNGADCKTPNILGATPVLVASSSGNVEAVRTLLHHGADVSAADDLGRQPIHNASEEGHLEVVQLLLDNGANLIVATHDAITLIYLASSGGHPDLVKFLTEKYADVSIAQRDGRLPVPEDFLFSIYTLLANMFQGKHDKKTDDSSVVKIRLWDTWFAMQSQLRDQGLCVARNSDAEALLIVSAPFQNIGENGLLPEIRANTGSMGVIELTPAANEPTILCDACRGIFEKEIGKIDGIDIFSMFQPILSVVSGNRGRIQAPSSSRQDMPVFYHHMSALSFLAAYYQGCYICKPVWDRIDPQMRQQLLVSDAAALEARESDAPFSYCHMMDIKSLMGSLSQDEDYLPGHMWIVDFNKNVKSMLDRDPTAGPLFTFVPTQEANWDDYYGTFSDATNSSESLSFVTRQFQNCLENHTECRGSQSPKWFPLRLISLESAGDDHAIRLVLSRDVTPDCYCTLSHCWGTAEFLKLTKDNFETFQRGIEISHFPKTFRDSFFIAGKLGVRYIWIDSLCIMQNDPDDWLDQASQMGNVYANSLCNICATGASDPTHGLFATRDTEIFRHCDATISWLGDGGTFRVLDMSTWNDQVLKAPLNTRAWVVQEHLLAPRHVHFGSSQIFWECLKVTAAEQFPQKLPRAVTGQMQLARRQLQRVETEPVSIKQRKLSLGRWAEIVARYTEATLSHPEDRIIAFAGIARRFESLLQDECVAGLWRGNLERSLLWHVRSCRKGDGTPSNRPEKYRAPSFSWMSLDGAMKLQSGVDDDDFLVQVLSMNIEESRDVIKNGRIRLKCRLKPLQIRRIPDPDGVKWFPKFQHGRPQLGWALSLGCWLFMDIDQHYEGIFYCVPIQGYRTGDLLTGLVLQATGRAAGEFRRIGLFEAPGEDRVLLMGHQDDEDGYPSEIYDAVQKRHTISIV